MPTTSPVAWVIQGVLKAPFNKESEISLSCSNDQVPCPKRGEGKGYIAALLNKNGRKSRGNSWRRHGGTPSCKVPGTKPEKSAETSPNAWLRHLAWAIAKGPAKRTAVVDRQCLNETFRRSPGALFDTKALSAAHHLLR